MKKVLVTLLALVFVLGIASTALAASSNPFVDLPQGHWAYAAVDQLAKAGIVEGYGDGTYRGDRATTRYEMAQVVARAMARSDQANAEQKALIDKLAVEFADELNSLGVRVSKLEDKTKIGLKFESMLRYSKEDRNWYGITNPGTNAFDFRQRVYFNGDVNDKVSYGARLQTDFTNFGSDSSSKVGFDQMYFNFNDVGGIDQITLGRFNTRGVTNGLLNGKDANNDGVRLTKNFGDVTFNAIFADESQNSEVSLYNLDFRPADNLKVNVGYQVGDWTDQPWGPGGSNWIIYNQTKSFDTGAQLLLGNVYLTGEYVSTKISNKTYKGYAIQLTNGVTGYLYPTYNLVDPNKAHSDAFSLSYRKQDNYATPVMSAFDNIVPSWTWGTAGDTKGYYFAYQNVLSKGVVATAEYQDLKSINGVAKNKLTVVDLQFFF